MIMILPTTRSHRILLHSLFLFYVFLLSAGCVHNDRQVAEEAFVQQLVKTSSTLEQKRDIANALEELKVVLTIDPKNDKAREELNRLSVKRDQEALKHFKAGIAARNSNQQAAHREFFEALKLRSDYRDALMALRELQFISSEAIVQARLKREAKVAFSREHHKIQEEDEDSSPEDYSLDIAISSFEDGDYVTAIREFNKMKARFPNDPDIQVYLDRSWFNTGMDAYAKKDYRKALASFSKVRQGFGGVDECMNKCRKALKDPALKKYSVSSGRKSSRKR